MKARVLVARHALHPMLVMFPLGLLTTSVVWDICRLATDNPVWGTISFWTIVAGVIGALLAAVPGFIDWLALPRRTRARTIGLYHMVLNLAVVALFVISLAARWTPGGYDDAGVSRMVWGWLAVAITTISAWLGGELIETHGISVREGASPNAPSSFAQPSGPRRGSRIATRREA
jgi:uncharacterized membrane protein